ncbi:MAG: glycogen/starch synthase [Alphaproteobacteria bacterium]|nr:glycogen/starch synthase [Alphaproteobacteria bacterium]
MTPSDLENRSLQSFLPESFNKTKFTVSYSVPASPLIKELQDFSRKQCLSKDVWPEIFKVEAWMVSAETATFMKIGGLGVIASELPEAYNRKYGPQGEKVSIITPLYLGDTKKKQCRFEKGVYFGSESNQIKLKKIAIFNVPFIGKGKKLIANKVTVYQGNFSGTDYLFLENDRYFSINPHAENSTAQDGCYVYNEHGVNEVERFAFFSKAVYTILKDICEYRTDKIKRPNIVIANDWHSGALAGLTKYLTTAKAYTGDMSLYLAEQIRDVPIIHIAHHLGYQGWDYHNTSKILNSLYDNVSNLVFKNAKAIKNSNPRMTNTLIVHDCYNQASTNFHLADRIVTVSKNYLEEVSKELKFGLDFRDILKMRKDHRNFFGIVNGYEKSLISPNETKVKSINDYFVGSSDFMSYDTSTVERKLHNKKEFIKLLSKIATDKKFKDKVLPKTELYDFADLSKLKNIEEIPVISATSRLAEQKGYDIAAQAILNIAKDFKENFAKFPIFLLGGAGDVIYYKMLKKLKDDITKINKTAGERVFVFYGYRDQFAYSIQLASDFYLMPCRFEPCGLTQMEAMAKGTIPITTSTGGLVDTIEDNLDGFRTEVFFVDKRRVFGNNLTAKRLRNNENAFTETMQKALKVFYTDKAKIKEIQKRDMEKDFSWTVEGGAIQKYYQLFHTGHI